MTKLQNGYYNIFLLTDWILVGPCGCGTAAVQSSSHMTIGFLTDLDSELQLRRTAPAPLLVFVCVDQIDRLQLDSGPAEVEFCAAAHGQS